MKSFSVNLTKAEWLIVRHLLDMEIDVIAEFIARHDEIGWTGCFSDNKEFYEDFNLRMISARKKIVKKLDENS